MDPAHGIPHDAPTPTARPDAPRLRGHARARSRDASADSHVQGPRDPSLGSSGRRVGEESNSRGSSPARPQQANATVPHTTPTLLRHSHNLKKCSGSEGGGGGSHGGRRRSPLVARKSTPQAGGSSGETSLTPAATAATNITTPNSINNSNNGGGSGGSSQTRPQHLTDDLTVVSCTEDGEPLVLSLGVSNGSGEQLVEGAEEDLSLRTREAVEHINIKMQKTRVLIKEEQKARDENVNEYLKLASNADRQQMTRIKAVFEKKNQKSAASIQQLQKKLENYHKRVTEIQTHGLNVPHHRQPKEMLRDMGQGLKTVISKPKEIAHLIKNKFGSADNIKELAGEEDRGEDERHHHGSATLPVGASLVPPTPAVPAQPAQPVTVLPTTHQPGSTGVVGGGGSSSGGGGHHGSKIGSEDGGSESNSSITSESVPGGIAVALTTSPRALHSQVQGPLTELHMGGSITAEQVVNELVEVREENSRLREEIESMKQGLAAEVEKIREGLAEERFRCEHLEEQINDMSELHQNEMGNLMTSMADMEEKVQYQREESIRDLTEIVENCHTRISRMEHQQIQQQQQFLTLEGLESGNARAVFVKLINVLLTVLQVLLLVVATIAGILTPLLQTRTRLAVTFALLVLVVAVYMHLPELRDLWHSVVERYTHMVTFK